MTSLFQRIINAYLRRSQSFPISTEEYNFLPLIFRVQARNDLDLSEDYVNEPVFLPARASARNLQLAERMRRYTAYRPTK